jgi:branched-chain amino acid aminotransferase
MKYTYFQDQFVPTEEAKVPTSDRGFRFGDGVFETIRVENGKLYNIDYHLNRMTKGLADVRIPLNASNLRGIARSLVKKNKIERGFVRIMVSRGSGSEGYRPKTKHPTVVIETIEGIATQPDSAKIMVTTQKAAAIANAKTMNALHYTLALVEAEENDCDNAILLDDDGYVCESASGNIFWIKDNILYTPSKKLEIIPGSIRQKVIALYKGEVVQGDFKMGRLEAADEAFMTNVNMLVMPISEILPLNGAKGKKFKSIEKSLKIRKLILDDIKSTLG